MSIDEQNNSIEREPDQEKQHSHTEFDLKSAEWFLNRELTWLEFNRRVLHEGQDPRTPLLERVFFLSVVGSNLDEFFMKRIGGLKQLVGAGVKKRSVDGRTPQEQICDCYIVVKDILKQNQILELELKTLLAEQGIVISTYTQLTKEQKTFANRFFFDNVYPLLTPQGTDPAHPFPFISNLSLNLLVRVSYPDREHTYLNRIKVPVDSGVSSRFIKIGQNDLYVPIEDIIANNLDLLFPGMVIESFDFFRVTRNAITERDQEQANDLLSMIESALRDRKFAEIVRLEVNQGMSPALRGMLAAEFNINEENDVFEVEGIIAKRHLMDIAGIDRPELRFSLHQPVDHPELLGDDPNIFHIIREKGSILLQHPYESFDSSVERFIKEASLDPKVLAVKMTLYRTAEQSRVIQYLIDAAQNGKQVAVVVELKARFDESANIRWARYLEEVGIHVTYGVVDLKTHSKVIFVVRRDFDGLHRYAHIGTGNYHAGTARGYSDLGLFTCDSVTGSDLTELFNYLTTGYTIPRNYKKILPCPYILKKRLLEKIYRESKLQAEGEPGLIQLKTNALEDKDITRALYKASQAGVHIDLIVRDTCRLRPGIPGLSENIRVISIVGRFLEHSRIFYFRNGGNQEFFISSADLMKRNLESRVEVCAPVESLRLQALLREMLDIQLNDRHSCWQMQSDGSYVKLQAKEGENTPSCFDRLIKNAEKRLKTAHRMVLKKGKAKLQKK